MADVSDESALEALVNLTISEFGRIDCLINNAGWHPPPKTIDEFSVKDMRDLFQLNFISYFAMCKLCLPHLRKVKGNIINMSSLVGFFGQASAPTYAATKGAITSFSKALVSIYVKMGRIVVSDSHLNTTGMVARVCVSV